MSRLFLAAGTNYVKNPTANSAAWTADGTCTITRETAPPVALPAGITSCHKIVHASGTWNGVSNIAAPLSVTPGGLYTVSAYIYAESVAGGDILNLGCMTYLGGAAKRNLYGNEASVAVSADNASFVRLTKTFTIAAGEDTLYTLVRVTVGTGTYYVAGVLLEKSPFATAYFDGSHAGCAWSGTANDSTSVRTISGLYYPPIAATLEQEGTLAVRYVPIRPSSVAGATVSIAGDYDTGAGMVAMVGEANTNWRSYVGSVLSTTPAWGFDAGVPHTLILRWDAAGQYLNVDGTDFVTDTPPTVGGVTGKLRIGGDGTYSTNAYIGPAIRSSVCKPDNWVAAIQADGGAAFDDAVRLVTKFTDPDDRTYPLVSDSRGYRKLTGAGTVFPAPGTRLVFDGNSQTDGAYSNYPADCVAQLTIGSVQAYNFGVSGQSTGMMSADAATQVDPLYDAAAGRNIVVVWNSSDITAETPEAHHDHLKTYYLARKAVGWQVVLLNVPPRTLAGYNANRNALNVLLAADWTDYADAFADIAADPDIGPDAAAADADYYYDGTHLTTLGYAIVASIVAPVIESLY